VSGTGGLSTLSITLAGTGAVWSKWTRADVHRDLQNIAGGFEVTYVDEGRIAQSLPQLDMPGPFFEIVRPGMACSIAIDGEVMLIGWIDEVDVRWDASKLSATLRGRDKTGDLVDCAALPSGPAEFNNVDMLHVANVVCQPFGITARADVDIGDPFDRLSLAPHETALAFLEKGARQRSLLLVSDGVGGLMLTRGGLQPGPSPLTRPGNIQGGGLKQSWHGRFSDYYVKGQTDGRRARSATPAALDSSVTPLSAGPVAPMPGAATTVRSTVLMTGHAIDPQITRYRPTVRLTRSQSGMSTTQEQAEWALRVARGQGDQLTYNLLSWRAGPSQALWRVNQVVTVTDPYVDIDKPMLVAGVKFSLDDKSQKTELRIVGVTAYDRINEAQKRRQRTTSRSTGKKLDASVTPLKAD
jgi:prophage tail gpP-like protein